jgi:hypothetical protein
MDPLATSRGSRIGSAIHVTLADDSVLRLT